MELLIGIFLAPVQWWMSRFEPKQSTKVPSSQARHADHDQL